MKSTLLKSFCILMSLGLILLAGGLIEGVVPAALAVALGSVLVFAIDGAYTAAVRSERRARRHARVMRHAPVPAAPAVRTEAAPASPCLRVA